MSELRRFLRRFFALFRPGKAESELTREIAAHLRLIEDQYIAKGMTPEEAHYAALRSFGGVEQVKELQRDARSFQWLAGWSMDLRLGGRMLAKSPGLTVIAVIALAVAIGAGVAYLEFVNDFFRPRLRFAGGDRLIGLVNYDIAKWDLERRSLFEFGKWKAGLTTVEEMGAARQVEDNLITDDGRTDSARGVEISASAFRIVPIAPLRGRPLLDDDEKPSSPPVLVIGEDVWKTRFNSDPDIIGRTVRFRGAIHTIVGLMPKSFGFPINSTMWTPLRLDPATFKPKEGPEIRMFGRLVPGASLAKAQAELESLGAEQEKRPVIKPFVESLWSNGEMLWQVVALYSFNVFFLALLAICAANVATLVFARTATRENEITVRTALGASRGRIVAQLVAEAFVLTSIAAIVGLGGGAVALRYVRAAWESSQVSKMPFWWNEELGVETIAYSVLLVIFASLLIGAVPALKSTSRQMHDRLKEVGSHGASMRFGKLWTGVVIVQIAVTVFFLLTLVALGWGLYEQHQQLADVAFPADEYLAGRIAFAGDTTPERKKTALAELRSRLAEDPAILNVGLAVHTPGHGNRFQVQFSWRQSDDGTRVTAARVGANYFETFRQPLAAGRLFSAGEIESEANVAIVDETFVRLMLAGGNAIGQQVRNGKDGPWLEIVGVVRDISHKPKKKPEDAVIYRPVTASVGDFDMRVVLHTRSGDAAGKLRMATRATDQGLRLTDVATIQQLADGETHTLSLFTAGLSIVASVALMLSTSGIYSLISFTLARRTREIGIRTALGAAPVRIITGILSRALVQVAAGVLLGSIAGAAVIRMGAEGSSGLGSWTTIGATLAVALFVLLVAMVSCVVPVRRALRVQPTEALRTT